MIMTLGCYNPLKRPPVNSAHLLRLANMKTSSFVVKLLGRLQSGLCRYGLHECCVAKFFFYPLRVFFLAFLYGPKKLGADK